MCVCVFTCVFLCACLKGESLLLGDLMALLRAVGAWEFSGSPEDFCRRSGLRHKAMVEVRKLRQQLTNIGEPKDLTEKWCCGKIT